MQIEKEVNKVFKSIELFGLPGCGKSYYSAAELKEYNNLNKKYILRDSRLIRNINKMFIIFQLFIFNPSLCFSAYKVINKFEFNNSKKKIKMYIYLLTTIYICSKAFKNENSLLEEGILQTLWGICYNSKYTDDALKTYIEMYKKYICKEIYFLDVNKYTLIERLLERKNKGGSELEHDIKKDFNAIEKAINIEKDIISLIKNENINFKRIEEN